MISPVQIWRRGLAGACHYSRTLPRIAQWQWPFWGEKPQTVPVHLLVGADNWREGAWTLASWFHFSENSWPVVLHDDGTLPPAAGRTLQGIFTKARLITRAEADAEMHRALKPFPLCEEARGLHPRMLRFFDVAHFSGGERVLLADPRLLFFSYPAEIMEWTQGKTTGSWFLKAPEEEALITAQEAKDELGVELWPLTDPALALLEKGLVDLDFCDRAFAQTTLLRGKVERIEQTLYTLCASRVGKGGTLSARYEDTLKGPARPDVVARLYRGLAENAFFTEGLPRLHRVLLAEE